MLSKRAGLIEIVFKFIGIRNFVSKMIRNPKRNGRHQQPPKSFYKKYSIKCDSICGRECYSIKKAENPRKQILYFHGSAYTLQAQRLHWRIIENLLNNTQYEITFVDYPLAPEYTCADTLAMSAEAYSVLRKRNERETILMGDSAGGGLALALAQYIKAEGLHPKPEKIVLFSPWLDVSMDNDISKEQEETDLILSKETLMTAGKKYAGGYDTKDDRCSPLYGDLDGLGEVALFIGTSEILYNQAVQLKEKFESHGKSITYYEYEKMQHVWVGFPMPEAKEAIKQAIAFMRR